MTSLSSSPLAVKTLPVDASDMRGFIGALMLQDGLVVNTTYPIVTQSATPGMSITVRPFALFLRNSAITALFENGQFVHSESLVDLTIASPPGTGSRTDLVVARVYDTDLGDAASSLSVEVLTGTTVVPPGAFELARVLVTAGVSSILNSAITANTRRAALTGGMIQCSTEADRPSASALPDGTLVRCLDYLSVWAAKGGVWRLMSSPALYAALGTDVASASTTLSSVSGLSVPVAPGGVYDVMVNMYGEASGSTDFNLRADAPAGSAWSGGFVASLAPTGATTSVIATSMRSQAFSATYVTVGTDGSRTSYATYSGLLTIGAAAGSVGISFSAAASGSAVLKAGSYLRLTRVA